MRWPVTLISLAALLALTPPAAGGYAFLGLKWRGETIVMNLQLAGGSRLTDGSSSFNAAVAAAMSTWNEHLTRVQFVAVNNGAGRGRDNDRVNQVFFDSTIYGSRFDAGTLSVTTRWYVTDYPSHQTETDIIFNSAYNWDSYRGNARANGEPDIRRLALHELGHSLGLKHPDAAGQDVRALMNSELGDLDALTDDDIAGAQVMYGAGAGSNISFPPRDEPNDFFNQLLATYANELRAAPSSTYIDPEGAVVWLTEYARQRVGQCDHATATQNTLDQLTGGHGTLVCLPTPSGPVPFPPRDEALKFMNELDATYRDALHRALLPTAVDNEGAMVWVLEYLRYRLNGCNHGDATTKVLQQIRTGVIAPTCTA